MRQWTLLTALLLLSHLALFSHGGSSVSSALPSAWSSDEAETLDRQLSPPPIPPRAPRPGYAALPPMRTTPPWQRPVITYSAQNVTRDIASALASAANSSNHGVRVLVQPVSLEETSDEEDVTDPLKNDWHTQPAQGHNLLPDGRRHFEEEQPISAMKTPDVIMTDASLGSLIDLSLRLLPCRLHGLKPPKYIVVSGGHPFLRAAVVGALLDDMAALTPGVWQRPVVLVGSAHSQGDDKDDFEAMHSPLQYKDRDRRRLIADSKNKSYLASRAQKTQTKLVKFLLEQPRAVVLLQTAATDLVPFLEKVKGTQSFVQVWATGFVSEDTATQTWVSGANARLDPGAARALISSSVQRYLISESAPSLSPKSMPVGAHPTLKRFYTMLMEYSPSHRPLLDLFAQALEFANVPLEAFTMEKHAPITSAKANALSGAFYRLLPSQIHLPLAGLDAFPFTYGQTRDYTLVQHFIKKQGSETLAHTVGSVFSTAIAPISVSILLVHPGQACTLYMLDKLMSYVQARSAMSILPRRDSGSAAPVAKSIPSNLLLAKAREALLQDAKMTEARRVFIAPLVAPLRKEPAVKEKTEESVAEEETDTEDAVVEILNGIDPEVMNDASLAERETEEANASAACPPQEEETPDMNPLPMLRLQLEADNHVPRPLAHFEVAMEGDDMVDRDFEASCLFSDASSSRPPLRVPFPSAPASDSGAHVRPSLHAKVSYPPLRAAEEVILPSPPRALPEEALPFRSVTNDDESAIDDVLESDSVEVVRQRHRRDYRRSRSSLPLAHVDPALLHNQKTKQDSYDAMRAEMSRSKSNGTPTMHTLVPQFQFAVIPPKESESENVISSVDTRYLLNPRDAYRSRRRRPMSDDNIINAKRPLSADARGYLGGEEIMQPEEGLMRKRSRTF